MPYEQDELKAIQTPITAEALIAYDEKATQLGETLTSDTFFEGSETYTIADAVDEIIEADVEIPAAVSLNREESTNA